ncbi:pectinacetylesterase family protein [Pendulispora brunnea]|uniref:Pectinacetylesterase family protein n=1 Tax=Pendulispora brunnea TaxID=2905690 RepID=A0ABZ2KJU6_9BACT
MSDRPSVFTSVLGLGACLTLAACSNDTAQETTTTEEVSAPVALAASPIQAPARTWTWVDFPGAHCRDGSGTGISVNWVPGSKKVLIYLDSGGACFSQWSCNNNRANGGPRSGNDGIFNRGNSANPFADYNQVFVPYCSGDWHAGNQPQGNVPGVGPQQFVGYKNLDLFLDRIIATFPDASQVTLTGTSAGGLGVFYNASHVARRFGNVPMLAIPDSGPPTPTRTAPACFQDLLRQLWNLDATVLADCGADCPKKNDYFVDLTMHYARGANHRTGIVNAYDDSVDIEWYNNGGQACSPPAPRFSTADWEASLRDLRQIGGGARNRFGTYYVPSTSHGWIVYGQFFSTTVNGTRMTDWTRDLLNGTYRDIGP